MSPKPKQQKLVIGLIILGVLLSAFFGMRAFHAFKKFNGHRPPPKGEVETDVELIRDWMTVPFISNMYHVRPETIFDALNITPFGNHDKSLKKLNQEYFPKADGFVITTVKATILADHAKHPPIPDSAPPADTPPTAPSP